MRLHEIAFYKGHREGRIRRYDIEGQHTRYEYHGRRRDESSTSRRQKQESLSRRASDRKRPPSRRQQARKVSKIHMLSNSPSSIFSLAFAKLPLSLSISLAFFPRRPMRCSMSAGRALTRSRMCSASEKVRKLTTKSREGRNRYPCRSPRHQNRSVAARGACTFSEGH